MLQVHMKSYERMLCRKNIFPVKVFLGHMVKSHMTVILSKMVSYVWISMKIKS